MNRFYDFGSDVRPADISAKSEKIHFGSLLLPKSSKEKSADSKMLKELKKKNSVYEYKMGRAGVEPATRGFSVRCSTT